MEIEFLIGKKNAQQNNLIGKNSKERKRDEKCWDN